MCAHVQKVIGAAFAEYISLDLGDFWLLFHNFWVLMMAVHLLTVILASLLLAHESAVLCPFLSLCRGVIGVGGIQCTLCKADTEGIHQVNLIC